MATVNGLTSGRILELVAQGAGAVDSVNGQTGDVLITAAMINAANENHNHPVSQITDFEERLATAFDAIPQGYDALPAGTTVTLWYNNGWPPRPTSRAAVVHQWCSVGYQGIPPTALAGVDFLRVMEYQSIPDPDPDPPIVEDGNILTTFDFEDQSDGLSVVPLIADWTTSGGGNTNFLASTAAAIHGSLGARGQGETTGRSLVYNTTVTTDVRVLDAYFNIRTIVANTYILSLAQTGQGTRADVRVNADRSVTCRSDAMAVGQTEDGFQLKTDNRYRISWHISPALQRIRIYDIETSEWVADFEALIGNSQHDRLSFGHISAAPGCIFDFDTFRVGDDWIPPHA